MAGYFLRRKVRYGYFYSGWPSDRYYILRMSGNGKWVHLYPRKNGLLPTGFSSKHAAQKKIASLMKTFMFDRNEIKLVSGRAASRYEVPKREE